MFFRFLSLSRITWQHIHAKNLINAHTAQKSLYGAQICMRTKRNAIQWNGVKIESEKVHLCRNPENEYMQIYLKKQQHQQNNTTIYVKLPFYQK